MNPWVLAARLPTLWAAVTPVLVGSGLAAADDAFHAGASAAALFGALAIQVGVNYANDAADARRGADAAGRLGPPRAVASGLLTSRQVWTGAAAAFALASLAGVYLIWLAGPWVVAIGIVSILAALGYTSGPAYGYHALGEVFVFAFFGPVATVGSRFVHDATAPADAWWMSIPVGLLITAILVVNNLRDIPTDRAAGKRTLAVVLGDRATRVLFAGLVVTAYGLVGGLALTGGAPPGVGVALITLPWAVLIVRSVQVATMPAAQIGALKAISLLQAAVGALAAAGMAAWH